MADQPTQQSNSQDPASGQKRPAGRPSDADGVVRKGGIARSDAEVSDVTRDTHGFPAGEGAGGAGGATPPPGKRSPLAIEADEALTEALEEAKGETEPAQQKTEPAQKTGNRGEGPEESEAVGE